MNYHDEKLMKGDHFKLIRVVSCDIFRPKLVRLLLKFLTVITSITTIQQVYLLYNIPNYDDFIKYGLSFVSTIYGILTYGELLTVPELIEKMPNILPLWAEDSCGAAMSRKINKEITYIKIFGLSHAVCGIINAFLFFFPSEHDSDNYLLFKVLEDNFYSYRQILGLPCRLVIFLVLYGMAMLGLHFLYITQHLKLQLYLFNDCLKKITKDCGGSSDDSLFYDNNYQKEIKQRLNFCIKRHVQTVQFIKLQNHQLGILIVLFSITGCILGITIMLLVFKGALYYNLAQTIMVCIIFSSTIAAIFIGSQSLQNESDKITEIILSVPWYRWNQSNKRSLLIFLINAKNPLRFQYSNTFVVDYKLGASVIKTIYSMASIFLKFYSQNDA